MPLSPDAMSYWMPIDFYVGGAEHACGHLMYARFITKALRDLGYLTFSEPFKRLFNQGMVHGEDGVVMSKSRGNVVDPLDISNKYGADTLRLFLVSIASPDKDSSWSANGVESMHKFVQRIFAYGKNAKFGKSSTRIQHKVNKAVIEISREIEGLGYNMAVIKLRALFDSFEDGIDKADFATYLQLLSPFAPHISEELWMLLGEKKSINISDWPKWDEKLIQDEEIKIAVQINGKVRTEIMIRVEDDEETVKKKAITDEVVLKYVGGGNIKKVIYVKNRLVNVVL